MTLSVTDDGSTIGGRRRIRSRSPPGLPHVKAKIIEERTYAGAKRKRVRIPTVVTERRVNYADRRDPVKGWVGEPCGSGSWRR